MARIIKGRQMAARYWKGREVLKEYKQGRLVYEKSTSIPDYLCFTALESGTFTLTIPAAVTPTYLSYVEWSRDGRTWNHTDNTSEAVTIDVQVASGEKVYWRGSGIRYAINDSASNNYYQNASYFSADCDYDASGNIMSLLYAADFADKTSFQGTSSEYYNLVGLFQHNEHLIHAANLSLPATTLKPVVYSGMFQYCSNMIDAPSLPAATLASYCYRYMFRNCTSLMSSVDLTHVTTVAGSCCQGMYDTCTALTSASIPSAAVLASSCYREMYDGCSQINHVKCLATDTSASGCLTNWLANVSSTGTFIQAERVEWPRGASGIPTGWVDIEKRTMPSGYKQLLQVTSNGTAYIQLSFGFEETDEVAATFSVDTSQRTDKYIVCPQTWNNKNNRYGMGVHNSGRYTAAFGNRSTSNTMLTPNKYNDGELHNWTYAAATFAVTDKSCSINITGYTFGGITTNLRLFYGYNSNTKGAISSYKHIKGSTTACDFVAAIRESDNTAGLYDLANDEFMTCNGLTAGEEI